MLIIDFINNGYNKNVNNGYIIKIEMNNDGLL